MATAPKALSPLVHYPTLALFFRPSPPPPRIHGAVSAGLETYICVLDSSTFRHIAIYPPLTPPQARPSPSPSLDHLLRSNKKRQPAFLDLPPSTLLHLHPVSLRTPASPVKQLRRVPRVARRSDLQVQFGSVCPLLRPPRESRTNSFNTTPSHFLLQKHCRAIQAPIGKFDVPWSAPSSPPCSVGSCLPHRVTIPRVSTSLQRSLSTRAMHPTRSPMYNTPSLEHVSRLCTTIVCCRAAGLRLDNDLA